MKRTVGTTVLFILLIMTVAALTQIDAPDTSALKSDARISHAN